MLNRQGQGSVGAEGSRGTGARAGSQRRLPRRWRSLAARAVARRGDLDGAVGGGTLSLSWRSARMLASSCFFLASCRARSLGSPYIASMLCAWAEYITLAATARFYPYNDFN